MAYEKVSIYNLVRDGCDVNELFSEDTPTYSE